MRTRDIVSFLSKIREKVNRHLAAEMAKRGIEGIGTSHGDIFYALFAAQKLPMAEIAKRIHKDKSTVTALVDKLVRLGYVTKDKDSSDSRIIYVALTAKGAELEPVFEAISKEMLETLYDGVSEQEQEELLRLLKRLYSNL